MLLHTGPWHALLLISRRTVTVPSPPYPFALPPHNCRAASFAGVLAADGEGGATFPAAARCPAASGSTSWVRCWRLDTSLPTPARASYFASSALATSGVLTSACGCGGAPIGRQVCLQAGKDGTNAMSVARDVATASTPLKDVAGLWSTDADTPRLRCVPCVGWGEI